MNAIAARASSDMAATISAEIEAIFATTKPSSLTKAEAVVAEIRDELAGMNELLAPFRAAAWKSGKMVLSGEPRAVEVRAKSCEARLTDARKKLADERENYAPLLREALHPSRRKAGRLIVEALAPLDNAWAILMEINRQTALSGLIQPDGHANDLNFIRETLRELARRYGVPA